MNKENLIAQRKNKAIYKQDDKVIKLFDDTYKTSDVLNEALNQARVYEAGLSVPQLIEVKKVDGKWAIVSEYVSGKTLTELLKENPDKIDEYLELFVDVQMSIHNQQAPHLNKLRDKMTLKIAQTDLDATTRYELMTRLEGMPKHKKVCHGDFSFGNVIITPEKKAVVIDWAHVTQGSASADVARTYLMFMLNGKEEIAEKYISLFCSKSDTARQYVQKWIPIVAASQLVKGNEKERDFLLKLTDVVEYE